MSDTPSPVLNLLRSAEQFPDRIAIQSFDSRHSYGQLLQDACAVAAFLRERGLAKGERVALVLDNGAPYVAAWYGVLMTGGIAVSLNTAAKAADLAAWLRHGEPVWVFGRRDDPELAAALQQLAQSPRLVWVDGGGGDACHFDEVLRCNGSVSLDRITGPQPAAIMYTSGTTGCPKGVVLSHENIASNAAAITQYLQLTQQDSIVSVLPFHYSYGASVLHSHLKAGGRIFLERNFMYPHLTVETLAKEKATGFAGVPSTFALLLSRVRLADYDLASLRYLTQAGGPMSPALTQKLRAALPATELFVMYGQTEATARLTYLPPAELMRKLGSVGIAIPGVEIEVRNDRGERAAQDEVGEIRARGPGIMLGYWRDASATAAVLHEGWLKTGDLGYQDRDGFLYLIGRRSDMIKTGAHRVYPQDVEEAIAELPAVREVAVTGVDDELLGQSVKAFVVLEAGADLSAMQIQAHCRRRLAAYKVPKSVDIVTALPKTAAGKLRRNELAGRMQT